MLTFLRKTRQSLIESGSTKKYLLYAIGEIALVVVGILIALQINNWNEHKRQTQTIKNYLDNLISDLQDDEQLFKDMREVNNFRYHSLQYLLKLSNEPPYDPSADGHIVGAWEGNWLWKSALPTEYDEEFIKLAFLWTHRSARHLVNRSTIEELKNTGLYSHLSQALKDAINAYYDNWDFRFGPLAFEMTQATIAQWQSALMDKGIINSTPFIKGDPIDLLKESPALLARVRNMAAHASFHVMSSKIIYEQSEDLQKMIKKKLEAM